MSKSSDDERRELVVETRLERTKRIRRQLDDVVRLWLEGCTVTETATRLKLATHRVYFLRRVLELEQKGRLKYMRPGHLYAVSVPPIDGSGYGA